MIYGCFSPRKRRIAGLRPGLPAGRRLRHGLAASLLLGAFGLAYGGTLGYLFHEAAFLTQPGDRLVVVFRPETPVAIALEQLGAAGATLTGTTALPGLYQARALDDGAAERLASHAWVMRLPGRPTFAGCIAFVLNKREAAQSW